tara:strand:+ start:2019 stop:2525 length:507 start_codon:yes stop_codon:yes gene_type:complete
MHTKINTALAFFISACGYVTISFQTIHHFDDYQYKIDSLWAENAELRQEVVRLQTVNESFRVTATMYHPVRHQTDSTPNELADGTIVDVHKAHTYRYVALSRDLLRRWGGPFDYGDYIYVENAGDHSGVWQVRDSMNSRWTHRIDFLMSPTHKPFKYEEVVIRSHKRS